MKNLTKISVWACVVLFACGQELEEITTPAGEFVENRPFILGGSDDCDYTDEWEAADGLNAVFANRELGYCYYAAGSTSFYDPAGESNVLTHYNNDEPCFSKATLLQRAYSFANQYTTGSKFIHKIHFEVDLCVCGGNYPTYVYISKIEFKTPGVCPHPGDDFPPVEDF